MGNVEGNPTCGIFLNLESDILVVILMPAASLSTNEEKNRSQGDRTNHPATKLFRKFTIKKDNILLLSSFCKTVAPFFIYGY